MDIARLHDAYRTLLDAAAAVAASDEAVPTAGEWDADQILAHVSLVNATTIAAVADIASGVHTTYDNRIAADAWTIDRVITLAAGNAGLRDRIRGQGEALCALSGTLSEAELDTLVSSRLLSGGTVLVDQPVPLRDLIVGLADVELPGHAAQILVLRPEGAMPVDDAVPAEESRLTRESMATA